MEVRETWQDLHIHRLFVPFLHHHHHHQPPRLRLLTLLTYLTYVHTYPAQRLRIYQLRYITYI